MSKYSAVSHLTKEEIIKSGSFFTPPALTMLVHKMCLPYISSDTVILELGSGYGAFISEFREHKKLIGTEYDKLSFSLLKEEFPDVAVYYENSLYGIDRSKYDIKTDERLIIIGNPPYNDTTSVYQKGKKGVFECDADVSSRDMGIAFLKTYNKLIADYICVLHPLSYLIKKQNFLSLKQFKDNYRLIDGVIFSSKEFDTIKKSNAEFPVVAALYERNSSGMTYKDITDFKFKIYKSKKHFCLSDIKTIDGIINKYPTNGGKSKVQFYTQRDMNSLLRNKAFVFGPIANGIDVPIEKLYQYAWLLYLKKNFKPKSNAFLYGNLSPLYTEQIENNRVKTMLVYYAYANDSVVATLDKYSIQSVYGNDPRDYSELAKLLKE